CLGLGEVGELDAPADVERRQPSVPDQVRGRSHAEQAEGEALELRVAAAPVVALADGREELVRAERQRANDVDLVEEDDKAAFAAQRAWSMGQRVRTRLPFSLCLGPLCGHLPFALCEHAVLNRAHEPPERAEAG